MSSFEAKSDTPIVPETKAATPPEPPKEPASSRSRVFNDPELLNESFGLSGMLSYCRSHGTRMEKKFISRYIVPIGVDFDKKGNAYKAIGENPVVLWSCHIDTVHSVKDRDQKIVYWFDKKTGDMAFQVSEKSKTACLGADDTCGIWLMLEMIKAKVPGLYIFHRGEECGRIGSKWIAEHNKQALVGIKYAIAFDRKGTKSIITYQSGSRCCSDDFAKSLAEQLDMGHECDTGGSYTDTASYVDLIPECTNVSAGYYAAHCTDEHTNVDYLFNLRDKLIKFDQSKLVEKRKPGENDRLYQSYSYSGGHAYGYYDGYDWDWPKDDPTRKKEDGFSGIELRKKYKTAEWMDWYDFDKTIGLWYPNGKEPKDPEKKDLGVVKVYGKNGVTTTYRYKNGSANYKQSDLWPDNKKPKYNDMLRMIKQNPEIIADLLEQDGYSPEHILDHLLVQAQFGQTVRL